MLKIYDYNDFRVYLTSYFRERKREQKSFSMRVWGRQLRVKSPATLSMVLNGQRAPGPELIEKFVTYFKFSNREAAYFKALVGVAKSDKDCPQRRRYLELIHRNQTSASAYTIELDIFETISNWYYLAIRELANLKWFREDPEWIQVRLRFNVPLKKIKTAVQRLRSLGFLCQDAEGNLKVSDQSLETDFDVPSAAIKHFHQENLELARKAVVEVPVCERYISSSYFCIDTNDLPAIKADLRKAQDEIMRAYEKSDGNAVYANSFSFFPVSRTEQPQGEK